MPAMKGTDRGAAVLQVRDVTVRRGPRLLLEAISLTVLAGEHWALLGPNGAGKTTLLRLLGAVEHPTSGAVEVLGSRLGRVDLRELRRAIGWVDPSFPVPPALTVRDVVLTGATGTQVPQPRWAPSQEISSRAAGLADLLGVGALADRRFGTLSAGERGRVLIARALVPDPRLLLLDEPGTGLDLAARELLLARLDLLASADSARASVTVTHHVEELPAATTHAALLRDGRLVTAGPVAAALTSERVSAAFGLGVEVERRAGRWSAHAAC